MSRFLIDPRQLTDDGKDILESPPPKTIDRDAFIDDARDTPAVKRDKKRRRQIARKQMVEQGLWPPSALEQTW